MQEAVKACVLRKYPNKGVNVAVARRPDLAIVQGAVHCVPLPERPASSVGVQFPVAPQFKSITSANSYGVVVSEVGQTSDGRGFSYELHRCLHLR